METSSIATSRFRAFFATQFCNAFNDNVLKNAIIILFTYKLSIISEQDTASLVTAAAGIFIIPFLLFSTLGGQLADRYSKTRLIRIIKSSEIFIVLLGSISFYHENIFFLLLTLFLMGTHSSFFGPIKFSILPEILKPSELNKGNAIIEASTFLAILFGTILGGVLIVANQGIYLVSALMITVALIGWGITFLMPIEKSSNHEVTISKNIISESLSIIRTANSYPEIKKAILGISWFWLLGATFVSLFPVYTKEILHAHAYLVTLFFVTFSVGVAAGSLIASKITIEKTYTACSVMLVTMTLAIIHLIAKSHPLTTLDNELISIYSFLQKMENWQLIFDLLLISMSGGIYVVPLYTILQTRAPSNHCARIIAGNNIMNSLFLISSAILMMVLFKLSFSVLHVFLILAIINVGFLLYFRQSN